MVAQRQDHLVEVPPSQNDASRQILDYYGRVHAVAMRLLTLRALLTANPGYEGLSGDVERRLLYERGQCHPRMGAQADSGRPRRLLKARYANIDNFR